ncbi:phage tail tube protein [Arthrobacter sp. D2-10]
MARPGPKMLNTANRKLAFVTTIANISAPTVTEANAGVELTCLVTAADFALGVTGNESITDPALCDDVETSVPGRATVEAGMNLFRFKDAADDLGWTTFDGRGLNGYLVQRIGQIDDNQRQEDVPFAAADKVQVYEVTSHDPQILSPATAGYEKFRQVFSAGRFDERAVIAAAAGA